jgi:transposase/DNA-binding XRE family transcriptional regulator
MNRPAGALRISRSVRSELQVLVRSGKTPQKTACRAQVILLAASGLANAEIARKVGLSRQSVIALRHRFAERGLDAVVRDAPRPGRKRRLSPAKVEAVVRKTLTEKPRNATHWSSRTMAKATGLSAPTILRIWRAHKLKPHLTRTFKLSNDPHFVEKVRDIVGLYLNPPDNALVLSVDEKSQIQALDRTQPLLPMGKGYPERRSYDYVRHGTATLFAALSVTDGTVIGSVKKQHRHQEFLAFLEQINRETPRGLDLHLVVDNYGTHKHRVVRAWLAKHPRFHMHFTPTSASWLNLVECWFSALTRKRMRRGVFRSLRALVQALQAYVRENNTDPTPFRWTKKAKVVLEKVRKCQELLDAIH